MTLMAIALMPWLRTVSIISFWRPASPCSGLRNNTSTSNSSAAFFVPASAIVQKDSALLLTNATLGLGAPALVLGPGGLGALVGAGGPWGQPIDKEARRARAAKPARWRVFMMVTHRWRKS